MDEKHRQITLQISSSSAVVKPETCIEGITIFSQAKA